MAARRPPSLRAVVTACSTDDRYADDVHYMGGCLLTDNLSWASTMFAYNSCPRIPRWSASAGGRCGSSGCTAAGSGWPSGCATSAATPTGGTARSARTTPPSPVRCSPSAAGPTATPTRCSGCLAALDVPRKGLIGPWSHKYPHLGQPGPAVGFLQELIRWWDHWLRDADNDVMAEPMLRIWMQESVPPSTAYEERRTLGR